ncbi:cell division protein ZapE [Jannaschia pagri]|uniref:Cell division protein ZapE n=1 Tax=Jannaschia pagri TaxID=2829797 RepID=A0ABQ4NPT0_9RHOB|nr:MULTISPECIES: cell division protein ZapE [unclassified Jannaschia]GIT92722.1 cell division protein ZapE [Jannaschia sp. AI_61]GIT96418.1 cell division protein ZapE [Jannaschia sp. AI_62]
MTLHDLYAARVADGTLTADPAQQAALAPLEVVRAALTQPEKRGFFGRRKAPEGPMGAYLWGGVGRGKSMLMDLFHEASPVPSRRIHFHAFMQQVHEAMHQARAAGTVDALGPFADSVIADVRVLCFDEMQITDITDAMIVGRLFEKLFEAGVRVVTTSNRVPDDLYKDGLNRALFLPFIEMVKDRMLVHELVSPRDYRQDRLAGEPVYFLGGGPLDDVWARLSGGRSEGLTLRVKGREIQLDDFASGVARASFKQLCGQPLGAGDYLALARAVRVLILTDVPQLDGAHGNEARRFITLIDALYEAKVRVIVSAAAEPEDLSSGAVFEFDRTASRLREMQGDGWGLT